MIDRVFSSLPFNWQLSVLTGKKLLQGDEGSLHPLWQRLELPKRPRWQSLASRLCYPFDWTFDKAFELASRTIPLVKEERYLLSITPDLLIDRLTNGRSLQSSHRIAKGWSGMSQERLDTCMAMLRWTEEDFQARYKACAQQVKHLNHHIAPTIVKRPRPQWIPDAKVCGYLDQARSIAELIDRGLPYPQELPVHSLTCEQLGDLSIGLKLLDEHYDIKQTERAVMRYVRQCNLGKTIAKVGLFAPPFFMYLLPKLWSIQLLVPLAVVLCLNRAWQMCRNAHDQFLQDQKVQRLIQWLFTYVIVLAYENYHAENARRTEAAAQTNAREERRQTEATKAKVADLEAKLAAKDIAHQQLIAQFERLKALLSRFQPFSDVLRAQLQAGSIKIRDERLTLSPRAVQQLVGFSLNSQALRLFKHLCEPNENKHRALEVAQLQLKRDRRFLLAS